MTPLALVASLPNTNASVPVALIDKKLSETALTVREKFQHAAWMQRPQYLALYTEKKSRIHTCVDGQAKIYDTTAGKIAGLVTVENLSCLTLNETRVSPIAFGRSAYTDYAVVRDKADNHVEILEQETLRPGLPAPLFNTLDVNLDDKKLLQELYRCGQGHLHMWQELVYETAIPTALQAAWDAQNANNPTELARTT